MKLFFLFLLSATASAASVDDVFPVGGLLDCRQKQNPKFGQLLMRDHGTRVRIYAITNGVNEGEKSRVDGLVMEPHSGSRLFVQHHSRSGDYGKYLEFVTTLQPEGDPAHFDGFSLFTEAFYSRDELGQEREELKPMARVAIRCTPL
ncbi:MAG TPA: hypothetical protein VIH99_01180 [Bdellovibrionota bacterium]|jgi:hypothetical protein